MCDIFNLNITCKYCIVPQGNTDLNHHISINTTKSIHFNVNHDTHEMQSDYRNGMMFQNSHKIYTYYSETIGVKKEIKWGF